MEGLAGMLSTTSRLKSFRLLQKVTRFRSVSCGLADFVRVQPRPASCESGSEPAEKDLSRSKDQLHSLRSLRGWD